MNKLSGNVITHIFNFLPTKPYIANSILSKNTFAIISNTKKYVYEWSRMKWRLHIILNDYDYESLNNRLNINVFNEISEAKYETILLHNRDEVINFEIFIEDNKHLLLDIVRKHGEDGILSSVGIDKVVHQLVYDKSIIQLVKKSNNDDFDFEIICVPLCYWWWHYTEKIENDYNVIECIEQVIRFDKAYTDYFNFVMDNEDILSRLIKVYGSVNGVVRELLKNMKEIQDSLLVKGESDPDIIEN